MPPTDDFVEKILDSVREALEHPLVLVSASSEPDRSDKAFRLTLVIAERELVGKFSEPDATITANRV